MKRFVFILVAIILLLGGCMKLNAYSDTAANTQMPQRMSATPNLSAPLLSDKAPVSTIDPGEKMIFSSGDIDNVRSLWPLKKCGIDDFGEPDSFELITEGKSLQVNYDIDTGKNLESTKRLLVDHLNGKWVKDNNGDYDYIGKSEGMDFFCGLSPYNSSCSIFIIIDCDDEYEEAVKFTDSHFPTNDTIITDSLGSPYKRDINLEDSEVTIEYTWNIADYQKAFEWYCGVMKKLGNNVPENDGKDLSAGTDIGSVYAIINVSEKSKTVDIRYRLPVGVEF